MSQEIYTKEDIINYLERQQKAYAYIFELNRGEKIPVKVPNINEDASESLLSNRVVVEMLFPQLKPIISIERYGKRGKDVLVNQFHVLELKATTSSEGTVDVSDSNFESFAWCWFNMRKFRETGKIIIPVSIITNPMMCLKPNVRIVEKNNQKKISLSVAKEFAKTTNNYYEHEINLLTGQLIPDKSSMFFTW